MAVRRNTDSVFLQYIWDALELSGDAHEYTLDQIFNYVQKERDPKCDRSKIGNHLNNAIRDKCVIQSGSLYKKSDWNMITQSSRHDSYCFVCHTCGPVLDCPTCFRVFHESCLNRIYNSDPSVQFADEQCSLGIVDHSQLPPNGPCPSCRRACNIKLDKTTTKVDLRSIYSTILEKMRGKNHWRTLCTVGYVNDSRRNSFFSFKDMNTRIISDKLKDGLNSYPTRTHLLADLDIIVHNAAVIYGCKAEMTNTARQLRTLIQKELMESSLCVDCYLRTKGGRPDARQNVQACRKAHKLIWFQFSSWSFRPCKVLSETSDGYEVICFDGRRERHFVPTNRAVQMSFTATQLGMRVTAALKHALDDAERYYENQKKVTPDLTYAEGLKHDDMVASSPANSVYSTSSATQSQPQTSKITAPKRRMDSNNRKTAPRPSPVSSKSTLQGKSKTDVIFGRDRPSPSTTVSSNGHRVSLISRSRLRSLSSSSDDDNSSSSSDDSSFRSGKYAPPKRQHTSAIAVAESSSDNSTTPALGLLSSSSPRSSLPPPNIRSVVPTLPVTITTRPGIATTNFFNRRNNVSDSDSEADSSPLESYSPPPPKKRHPTLPVNPIITPRPRAISSSSKTTSNGDDNSDSGSSLLESGSPPGRRLFPHSSKNASKSNMTTDSRALTNSRKAFTHAATTEKKKLAPSNEKTVIVKKSQPLPPAKPETQGDIASGKATALSVSSVSPAAMSSSSGIGSSLNGNETSPGDLVANGCAGAPDSTVVKAIEDRIRKEVMGRLAIVSQERDNANDRIKELESKLQQLEQEHAQEILEVKRKAWCCYCFEPAVYHCCSGFAYCSRSCQVKDWDESHRSVCTRNLENGTA